MTLKLFLKNVYWSLKRFNYLKKDIQDCLQWPRRNSNAQGEIQRISGNVPGILDDEVVGVREEVSGNPEEAGKGSKGVDLRCL